MTHFSSMFIWRQNMAASQNLGQRMCAACRVVLLVHRIIIRDGNLTVMGLAQPHPDTGNPVDHRFIHLKNGGVVQGLGTLHTTETAAHWPLHKCIPVGRLLVSKVVL